MHLPDTVISAWILQVATWVAPLILLIAVSTADWRAIAAQPGRLHLVGGGAVACMVLWLLNIHLVNGLVLHFLGVTTLTLLLGWSFSVLAGTLALVGFFSLQSVPWSVFPLSLLLTVVVPACVSRALAGSLYRPALRHPFVYFLGAGFAGGGLVVLVLSLTAALLFWLSGVDSYLSALREWWPLLFLIMFSEGFINGMCVSALAVFYPDWMKTFDDRFYLDDS